jgi:hypothetical protein
MSYYKEFTHYINFNLFIIYILCLECHFVRWIFHEMWEKAIGNSTELGVCVCVRACAAVMPIFFKHSICNYCRYKCELRSNKKMTRNAFMTLEYTVVLFCIIEWLGMHGHRGLMWDLSEAHNVLLLFPHINISVNAINIFIINSVVASPRYICLFPLFSVNKNNGKNYKLRIE